VHAVDRGAASVARSAVRLVLLPVCFGALYRTRMHDQRASPKGGAAAWIMVEYSSRCSAAGPVAAECPQGGDPPSLLPVQSHALPLLFFSTQPSPSAQVTKNFDFPQL
jgi:hypothetical protein